MDILKASSLPPVSAEGLVLRHITFDTCPGTSLRLSCARVNNRATSRPDGSGVHFDSWWIIYCHNLPNRYYRLRRGSHSLFHLVKRYGFLDDNGCVNHRRCRLTYGDDIREIPLEVEHELRDCVGVPQFYKDSGVCWFASFCWIAFGNESVKRFLIRHHPEEMRISADRCLMSPTAAEEYRKQLWYKFSVGDDVDDHPLNDGKNGAGEFTTMCAKFKIPLIRLKEERGMMVPIVSKVVDQRGASLQATLPHGSQPHILMLRFTDGDHSSKFPVHRRITYGKRRYRLFGIFLGQRKCGHQCGMVCSGSDWKNWGVTDADAHKDGISPCFCHFTNDMKDSWWEKWRLLVTVTKYGIGGNEFCPLTPWNVRDDEYDKYKGAGKRSSFGRGSLSIDTLYFYDGDSPVDVRVRKK